MFDSHIRDYCLKIFMTDQKKIILLAEDDKFLRSILQKRLEEGGYTVCPASDGLEALDILDKTIPDLVLLDLIMPRKNGFEVLQEMRANAKLKSVPVVVLSNLSQDKDMDQAKDLGIAGYITKSSVSLVNLLDEVRKYMYPHTK